MIEALQQLQSKLCPILDRKGKRIVKNLFGCTHN